MMVATVEIKISLHKRRNITESCTTQPSHNVPDRTEFCRQEQNYNNRILIKEEPTFNQGWAQISWHKEGLLRGWSSQAALAVQEDLTLLYYKRTVL